MTRTCLFMVMAGCRMSAANILLLGSGGSFPAEESACSRAGLNWEPCASASGGTEPPPLSRLEM